MKRLTLLTILLVVVGLASGFGLELKPSFELTGSASVEWGIDLSDWSTGFLNSAEADLTLNLFAEDTEDTKKGEGDWYGSITLSDIEAYFTADEAAGVVLNGEALGVEATIVGMGGDLVIGVFDAPTIGFDFVTEIEDDADDDYVVPDDEDPTLVGGDYGMYGTFVSYNISEMLMLGFEVVSEDEWIANDAQAYAFALEVQVTLDALEIDAGVNYGFNYATSPLGFGVNVAFANDMVDAWVGFDGELVGGAFAYEVGGGATFTLLETVTAEFGVVYGADFQDLDAKVVFTEPGEAGLVDMLDASLTVWVLDVLDDAADDDLEYEVLFEAGYEMGKLYPHFGVEYGDPNTGAAYMEVFVHCDVDLFEAAPTTLYVEWNSGDLLASALGEFLVGVSVEY